MEGIKHGNVEEKNIEEIDFDEWTVFGRPV